MKMSYVLLLSIVSMVLGAVGTRRLNQQGGHVDQDTHTSADLLYPRTCEEVYLKYSKARESDSCSLESTMPYVGPLQTWDNIRAMLDARSHKGEIILSYESREEVASQWQLSMLRRGWSHTVIVSRGEHACGSLRELYGNHVGCVWFPHTMSYPGQDVGGAEPGAAEGSSSSSSSSGRLLGPGQVAIFLQERVCVKMQLAAMILRLGGYNVLMLDTDVMPMDDFYWWMRHPDYKDFQLLSQWDGMGTINNGVMYFRGTAPGGPSVWALTEALARNIRWREQPQLLTKINASSSICWDQSVLTDTVYSALVGRPIFWRCLEQRPLDPTWATREDGRKRFLDATESLFKPLLQLRSFSMNLSGPSCHHGLGPLQERHGRLVVPHAGGQWPEELGGRALGAERGPVAAAFMDMMRDAGTPMWPDPEDPDAAAAAAAVPPEAFSYFSRHIVCDWSACGSNGMYQPQLRPPGEDPCVVLAHFVVSPGSYPTNKRFQHLINGQYSMQLAQRLHGPGGPYFATNTHHSAAISHHGAMRIGANHGNRGRIDAPKVLALDPAALSPGPSAPPAASSAASSSAAGGGGGDGGGGGSAPPPLVLAGKEALVELMKALSSVAVAAGRTLAVPRLSCDFPWMHRGPAFPFNGSHYVPWRYLVGEAFAPFGPSLERLSCEWYAFVQSGCLHGPVHTERTPHTHINPHPSARLLLSVEMQYFLEQLPPSARVPSLGTDSFSTGSTDSTTAAAAAAVAEAAAGMATSSGGLGGGSVVPVRNLVVVPPGSQAGPDGVYNVTAEYLWGQLRSMDSELPVVWLQRPMRVVDLPEPLLGSYQRWVHQCCALMWPHGLNHVCHWPFR